MKSNVLFADFTAVLHLLHDFTDGPVITP